MLDIRICNLRQSSGLYHDWATKTLSIVAVGEWPNGFDKYGPNHWVAEFDDVVDARNSAAPSLERMAEVVCFANNISSKDRILIHCSAGVSRSPAVAIMLQIMHGMDPREAVMLTYRTRPQMKPNDLVIEVADRILGLNGDLVAIVREWQKSCLVYDLGDFVD